MLKEKLRIDQEAAPKKEIPHEIIWITADKEINDGLVYPSEEAAKKHIEEVMEYMAFWAKLKPDARMRNKVTGEIFKAAELLGGKAVPIAE